MDVQVVYENGVFLPEGETAGLVDGTRGTVVLEPLPGHPQVIAIQEEMRELLGDRKFADLPFDRASVYEDDERAG